MYSKPINSVIGFHACEENLATKILNGETELIMSENKYDWLGYGIYFWEDNLGRAIAWGKELEKKDKSRRTAVIGALIDLGSCLNFANQEYLDDLNKKSIEVQTELMLLSESEKIKEIPKNKDKSHELDCFIINNMISEAKNKMDKEFDSVRGIFIEGDPICEGSGFTAQSHIQISIRNPNCIKGYFNPKNYNIDYRRP